MYQEINDFVVTKNLPVVLLDGQDHLSLYNTFDKLISFINELDDLVALHEETVLVPGVARAITTENYALLPRERELLDRGHCSTDARPSSERGR